MSRCLHRETLSGERSETDSQLTHNHRTGRAFPHSQVPPPRPRPPIAPSGSPKNYQQRRKREPRDRPWDLRVTEQAGPRLVSPTVPATGPAPHQGPCRLPSPSPRIQAGGPGPAFPHSPNHQSGPEVSRKDAPSPTSQSDMDLSGARRHPPRLSGPRCPGLAPREERGP